MAAIGDSLYVLQNGYLHEVNPSTGAYRTISDQIWDGATSMSSAGNELFIVQADTLHRVTLTQRPWSKYHKLEDNPGQVAEVDTGVNAQGGHSGDNRLFGQERQHLLLEAFESGQWAKDLTMGSNTPLLSILPKPQILLPVIDESWREFKSSGPNDKEVDTVFESIGGKNAFGGVSVNIRSWL